MVRQEKVVEAPVDRDGVDGGVDGGAGDWAGTSRPMRADARRNYDRLVAAARRVFAADGAEASMESIAREAGVGVGTLYRHFPKRIDLVEAVYFDDISELERVAQSAVSELDPWEAVAAFLPAFIRYGRGKRTFLSELREAFERNPALKSRSRERVAQAMAVVIENAESAGVIRPNVEGSDLMELLAPMCMNASLSEEQIGRLLDVIIDGLRLQPSH